MREQFTVDLRGLVEILSHHLYRNERVYLRELVQNAHDAIRGPRRAGRSRRRRRRVEIVPARGYEQLVVRDNGIGLTEADMRALLSIIGSTSKRADVAAVRRQFLGQFGIGLLSCFLVADTIEVISRSARTPDAPTVRWVGESDGTFTIGPALQPLAEPRHRGPPAPPARLPTAGATPRRARSSRASSPSCSTCPSASATARCRSSPGRGRSPRRSSWPGARSGSASRRWGSSRSTRSRRASSGWRSCCPTPRGRATARATASTRRACWSPTPTTSSSPAGRSSAAPSWTRATCRSRRRAKASRSPASSSSCASRSGSGCSPS